MRTRDDARDSGAVEETADLLVGVGRRDAAAPCPGAVCTAPVPASSVT